MGGVKGKMKTEMKSNGQIHGDQEREEGKTDKIDT